MRVTARSKTVPPAGVIEQGVSWHRRTLEALLDNNLLVVVILVQTLLILVIGRRLLDLDSWLTLMAGREIVQHGLPHHEVITTLPAGRDWVDQQWLAQLVFYGLHRLGGLGLAVVFHALMIGTALTITIVGARVRGASTRMTLLASSICLIVAPWSWQLRAQSIALPLFALTLALTSTDQALEAGRTTLVFPALVLWANIHGSVVIGAALVSTAGVLALARYLRARGRRGAPRPWRQLVFLAAPWACVLASPYGADLAGYYRLILFDSPVSRHITEWQAPRPHGYFLVFFAVAATTVAVVVWQRRRLSAYDIVALALTLAVALRSVRAVVWFSLAMALLLPLALDGLLRSGAESPRPPTGRGHVDRGDRRGPRRDVHLRRDSERPVVRTRLVVRGRVRGRQRRVDNRCQGRRLVEREKCGLAVVEGPRTPWPPRLGFALRTADGAGVECDCRLRQAQPWMARPGAGLPDPGPRPPARRLPGAGVAENDRDSRHLRGP